MRNHRAIDDPLVAVAYGRQLPHHGAKPIEAHARTFNYGPQSTRKDRAAAASLGVKVFFCSNSFAAYRRSLLLRLGGFRDDLILGEDMEYAARAIKAGYVDATAALRHSHDYNLSHPSRGTSTSAFSTQKTLQCNSSSTPTAARVRAS